MDMYGENIEVVFSENYTHFKKRIEEVPHKPPFEGLYVDDTACTRYCGIVKAEEANVKRAIERERKRFEIEQYKDKKRGNRRKK
jgi:hypothetical protein